MWLKLDKTKEFIPVNENMTEKVFLDGQNGWAVKQRGGQVYHISDEQKNLLDNEIDPKPKED